MITDMVYSLDSSNSVIKRCGKTHFCLKIKKKESCCCLSEISYDYNL